MMKKAFKDTIPVMSGYIVLGIGFGIVLKEAGYGFWWALAMSVFIYAGSMQYVGVGLLTGGASLISTALTTLLVNARHLFYGVSMLDKYRAAGKEKPYLIFALTDETYSLVCTGEKEKGYYLKVSLMDQCYWVLGSVIGSLIGTFIHINFKGVDFSLTALFITVFMDQWLHAREHFSALTGVLCSVVCLLIFGPANFLIPAMILITAVLLAGRKKVAA